MNTANNTPAPAAVLAALALTPLTGGGLTSARAAGLTLAAAIEATAAARPPAVYGSQERTRATSFKKTALALAEDIAAASVYVAPMLERELAARGWALTAAGLLADGLGRDRLAARVSLIEAGREYRQTLKEAERNRARAEARRDEAEARAAGLAAAAAAAVDSSAAAALAEARAKLEHDAEAWAERLAAAIEARDPRATRRVLEDEAPALARKARALGMSPEALGLA